MDHLPVSGSKKRNDMPVYPPRCPVRNSSWLPMPSRILCAVEVASNSTHSSQPTSHLRRCLLCTCQSPIRKSKSCTASACSNVCSLIVGGKGAGPPGDSFAGHASDRIGRSPPATCGRLGAVLATTARLLELLELLQERPVTTRREVRV